MEYPLIFPNHHPSLTSSLSPRSAAVTARLPRRHGLLLSACLDDSPTPLIAPISFMPFLLYQGKSTLLITQVILDGKSMKDLKNLLWIWMETLSLFLQQKQDKCLMHSRYSQVLLG